MTEPFATPTAPTNLTEGHAQAPADDLDFDASVPAMQLGIFPGHVLAVKKGPAPDHDHKLIVEFVIDDGPKGTKVSKWADPAEPEDMTKIGQVVNALGVDMVLLNGKLKPECGWVGLKDRPCRVVLDEYQGKYQIPRYGKGRSDQFPANLKDRDFGCGILPIE